MGKYLRPFWQPPMEERSDERVVNFYNKMQAEFFSLSLIAITAYFLIASSREGFVLVPHYVLPGYLTALFIYSHIRLSMEGCLNIKNWSLPNYGLTAFYLTFWQLNLYFRGRSVDRGYLFLISFGIGIFYPVLLWLLTKGWIKKNHIEETE